MKKIEKINRIILISFNIYLNIHQNQMKKTKKRNLSLRSMIWIFLLNRNLILVKGKTNSTLRKRMKNRRCFVHNLYFYNGILKNYRSLFLFHHSEAYCLLYFLCKPSLCIDWFAVYFLRNIDDHFYCSKNKINREMKNIGILQSILSLSMSRVNGDKTTETS